MAFITKTTSQRSQNENQLSSFSFNEKTEAFKNSSFTDGVVISGGFSILPSGLKTSFKAKYQASAAHKMPETSSARLSAQITDFLKRSDHVLENTTVHNYLRSRNNRRKQRESSSFDDSFNFSSFGNSECSNQSEEDNCSSISYSREISLDPIEVKIENLSDSGVPKSPNSSSNLDELNSFEKAASECRILPITIEKSEKRESLASSLSSKDEVILRSNALQHAFNSLNIEQETEDECSIMYRKKWERSQKDLKLLRNRIIENDVKFNDKIVVLKKSLEDKLLNTTEEAYEQKQIVSRLRKQLQDLNMQCSDTKALLDEEVTKSEKLERKLKTYYDEMIKSNGLLTMERANAEELVKERNDAISQAEFLRAELHRLKLDLHLKEEKLSSMGTDLTQVLREKDAESYKTVLNLQAKLRKQEEEFELLGDEAHEIKCCKQRLEEQIDQLKRKHKIEIQQHEDELNDLKEAVQKKMKILEQQISEAQEEKLNILRSMKELEQKLVDCGTEKSEALTHVNLEQVISLKKDLKRAKILIKDSQAALEELRSHDFGNKAIIRQLKIKLEQGESERSTLMRLRSKAEQDTLDAVEQLSEINKSREVVEAENNKLLRERHKLQIALDDCSSQLSDVMKKYQTVTDELGANKSKLADQILEANDFSVANSLLKHKVSELKSKIQILEDNKTEFQRQCEKSYKLKLAEVESQLELSEISKQRSEFHIQRLKDYLDSAHTEIKNLEVKAKVGAEHLKRAEKYAFETKKENKFLKLQEEETRAKNANLEKLLEITTSEANALRHELKVCQKRIEDLTIELKIGELRQIEEDENENDLTLSDCSMISDV